MQGVPVSINVTINRNIANNNTTGISIYLSKTVNHFGNNQFMALSQLQKANQSYRTLVKDSQAWKKLDPPYGPECIMSNMKNRKWDNLMMNGISIAKATQLTYKITFTICLESYFFSFLPS